MAVSISKILIESDADLNNVMFMDLFILFANVEFAYFIFLIKLINNKAGMQQGAR
jgi:hypothetical protein